MVIHLPFGLTTEEFACYVDIDNDVVISADADADAEADICPDCAEIQAVVSDRRELDDDTAVGLKRRLGRH